MTALGGARVVVVDDELKEALPIIQAFSKRGVATVYFDGTTGALPAKNSRLKGVRLAVLDLVLAEGATNDIGKITPTIATLNAILSSENGPYGVILWTKHQDLKELFEGRLFGEASLPRSILTVMIEKSACKNKDGTFSLWKLSKFLDAALIGSLSHHILQEWESKSHMASAEVVNSLSKLASPVGADLEQWRDSWGREVLQMMHGLAKAEAGKALDSRTFMAALFSSLNPLHADRMEAHPSTLDKLLEGEITAELAHDPHVGTDVKARVNAMLHLATEDLDRFLAGNIYRVGTSRGPRGAPTASGILSEMWSSGDANARSQVESASVPVIVECTAACDHAQGKIRVAKFVAGVLVPEQFAGRLHPARHFEFVWELGPLRIERGLAVQANYDLRISARHWMTLGLGHARQLRPIGRLRAQALADLQAFLGRHASRPGMMSLD